MDNKCVAIIGLFLLLAMPMAFADLGPKPSMDFSLSYNTSAAISVVGGEQYQCMDQACIMSDPLGHLGPQHFECTDNNTCYSIAYSYNNYQKIVINFSDRTRESNVFNSISGSYDVVVTDTGLVVTPSSLLPIINNKFGILGLFVDTILALLLTLIIELPVSLAYLAIKKIKKPVGILSSVAIANIISVPILWAVVYSFPGLASLAIMEMLVILFEACFIHLLNKKKLKLKESFIMSIAMNLASIIIGVLLIILLA